MPRITALLRTENDGLRLGRCLELLHPCDDILVVDHGSTDQTLSIAREYGARITRMQPGNNLDPRHCLSLVGGGWILCLDPRESLTEALAASLFEWKLGGNDRAPAAEAYSVFLREETGDGWFDQPAAQTRLVPATWDSWDGMLPAGNRVFPALEGSLLRFAFP